MWQIYALVLHLALLGAIVMVYFQAVLLQNLQPQRTLRELGQQPPADRLVVFLTDGFRAESFFANNCSTIPNIQELLLQQGLVGISTTCAPTQSRPGHIAVFGGFYEDPSAALYNFKWNPTQFDTVFNRSRNAYGWMNIYIYNVFMKLETGGQPLKFEKYILNDFMDESTADIWVFEKVRNALNGDTYETLRNATSPVVFFVYSGDLDVAAHTFKPGSERFLQRLRVTEAGIKEIYELFERKFPDQRNVYLLTSDHGMTDWGSHGGDSLNETEVPFYLWGAGVNRVAPNPRETFVANAAGTELPLHRLEQTQMAPLMSALIGLPPPMNSKAVLPIGYMNVSAEYEAHAVHTNVLQLLEQVEQLLQRHQTGYFSKWLPRFNRLCAQRIADYKQWCQQMLTESCYANLIESSQSYAQLAIECIDYYSQYYRNALVLATIASYAGWCYYLLTLQARVPADVPRGWNSLPICLLGVVIVLLSCLLLLQQTPLWTGLYLIMPLFIWALALRERGRKSPLCLAPIGQLLAVAAISGLVIASFSYNQLMALGYVVTSCVYNRRAFARPTPKFFVWLALVMLLGLFQMLSNKLGHSDEHLLYASMLLVLACPLITARRHAWYVWLLNTSILLVAGYGVYLREHQKPVCAVLHAMMWLYMAYSYCTIPFVAAKSMKSRCELSLFNLSTLYTLLSLSEESIFMQLLCYECMLNMELHQETRHVEPTPAKPRTATQQLLSSYQYAVLLLIYTYFSFFGTGNEPTISSFDPNVTRLFVSDYHFYIMTALVLLKLFLPALIVLICLYAHCSYARQHSSQIFYCLFLISDAMSLYFFCFMRNKGIWSEVRYSISHLMIVHCTSVLLLGLSYVAKLLLCSIQPIEAAPKLQKDTASSTQV